MYNYPKLQRASFLADLGRENAMASRESPSVSGECILNPYAENGPYPKKEWYIRAPAKIEQPWQVCHEARKTDDPDVEERRGRGSSRRRWEHR